MRFPASRRFARRLLRLLLLLTAAWVIGAIVFVLRCPADGAPLKVPSAAALERRKVTAGIANYERPEVGTWLSYPEWYIVWSYQERADYQQTRLPSRYPFFGSIGQYWSGYCCVYSYTRGRYAFDVGHHVMLAVIGTSFSFEYLIRGLYEGTVGRITDRLSNHQPTDEDRYAYKVAREYADFVHVRPFYEFSFWKRFKGLWSETSWWGPNVTRKYERKAFLALDYGVEAFYCWIIEQLTHASYGYESADTYAWLENVPADLFTAQPRIRKIKEAGPGAFVVVMPRYQEFTTMASWLAARDVRFVEIAGNDEVLLTALAPAGYTYDGPGGNVLLATPLLTKPETQRIALRAPVGGLHAVLNHLAARGLTVEHIYDY